MDDSRGGRGVCSDKGHLHHLAQAQEVRGRGLHSRLCQQPLQVWCLVNFARQKFTFRALFENLARVMKFSRQFKNIFFV